jgi:nitrogen fixation protein FixH
VLQTKQLYHEIRREGAVAWQLKTTVEDLETSVRLRQEEGRAVELERVLMDLKRLLGPHAVGWG